MDSTVKRTTSHPISHFSRLGREIRISPKTHISVMAPGYKTEFFVETIEVLIGIGADHTASLIMAKEAWEELKNGELINITTTEEYKKMYEYKIRKK